MKTINFIAFRKIYNSHVNVTHEYIIKLVDGSSGIGSSPQGETISIYEDKKKSISPQTIIDKIKGDGYIGKPVDQEHFDEYLERNISEFGRNNVYSLSLALFKALESSRPKFLNSAVEKSSKRSPRLCCNILNGGWHAYTNPVLSDFHEYLLVPKSHHIDQVISEHNEIQQLVKKKLRSLNTTIVGENTVYRFATKDNRECIDFLLSVLESLGLSSKYDLMIDASAGDLWTDDGYLHSITDYALRSSDKYCDYWMDIIDQYKISLLEDPFREIDKRSWNQITAIQEKCNIIGDNFYSSNANRISEGAVKKYTHGVVIKPNQSGTITAVRKAIETAQTYKQIIIASHRSISTEETLISTLSCMYNIPFIKIGPLQSDYSSVLRLNEIIRLTKELE